MLTFSAKVDCFFRILSSTPITLFAPTLAGQNEILAKLFEDSEDFSYGSDGFRVASEYFFKKASDWYRSPKEGPRLDQAGCGMVRELFFLTPLRG